MKERSEINERYLWNTEDLIPGGDKSWETRFAALSGRAGALSAFAGKLGNKEELLRYFQMRDEMVLEAERLYVYAHMNADTDTRSADGQSRVSRARNLFVRMQAEVAFADPELSALDEATLRSWSKDPQFFEHDRELSGILRAKAHILSAPEEALLAEAGEMSASFQNAFTMFDNADLTFPEIEDETGTLRPLSHASYAAFLQNRDQSVRRRAFLAYYAEYRKKIHTIAALYAGNVQKDCFYQRARKFSSCLEQALFYEEVEPEVYENLIRSVSKTLGPVHEYVRLRKKLLGLSEQHMYDLYVPIAEDGGLKLGYEEAYDLCEKALSVLGEEYIGLFHRAREERWIDVYETPGKRSGAYSTSVYGVHPYALLNYEETTHDVFTIAHEMGHALHSYYSNEAQPYAKSGYTIFVAEVASTCNEVLTLSYLLERETDPKMRKFLLSYYLDMFRTTVYRQTMFSEFEAKAHELCENGTPLTAENLSELYLDLNVKYYGDGVISDDDIRYEWARIPHFYTSFYVYKYATGMIAAVNIARQIQREGAPAVEEYKRFLKGGCSATPVELLKVAGVDLLSDAPYELAAEEVQKALSELASL